MNRILRNQFRNFSMLKNSFFNKKTNLKLLKIPQRNFCNDKNFKQKLEQIKTLKELQYFLQKEYKNNKKQINFFIAGLLIALGLLIDRYIILYESNEQELKENIDQNKIELITIRNISKQSLNQNLQAQVEFFVDGHYHNFISNDWKILHKELLQLKNLHDQKFEIELTNQTPLSKLANYKNTLSSITTLLMLASLTSVIIGGTKSGGLGNMMKDSVGIISKQFEKKISRTKFKDVAGLEEPKNEISEFVEFLRKSEKFTNLGAKIPRGALLTGPPGTGKTLLIKALAGEANVPFYAVSGSEFVEMFVGMGASRVRKLFEQAKAESPAIIFIDEIDAIGRKRAQGLGANTESDSTLNQLLVEMDGFNTQQKVIVFGATNRKELLDDALLRPGRFDRLIDVSLPDLDERKAIYKIHLSKIKLQAQTLEEHAKRLASLSPGFSGADIMNVCNEAAIYAVRNQHEYVLREDFEMAIERVIGGLEREYKGEEDERKIVAYHECGHGVASWFLEGANPLLKLTIIPRTKGALGFAQYLPNEDSLQSEMELRHQIISILGGRVSEEHFFGRITTGAFDDLQKAYRIARALVTKLGMVDEVGLLSLEENQFGIKNYSDKTNFIIDKECEKIIKESTEECRVLIKKHAEDIKKLSEILLQKQTIDLNDITKVLGQRPFLPKRNFQQYLEESLKTIQLNYNELHKRQKQKFSVLIFQLKISQFTFRQ